VEYSTPEEAQTAIKTLNDTSLPETDRMIFVREDREDKSFSQSIQRGRDVGTRGYRGSRGGGGYASRGGFRGGYGGERSFDRGERSFDRGERSFDRGAPLRTPTSGGRQVFVGNLPYTTSWQDLKDKFRQVGNIIRADILLDTTGRSKGQGTVLFESSHEAQKAIRLLDNTDFGGRIITVHEDKFAQ